MSQEEIVERLRQKFAKKITLTEPIISGFVWACNWPGLPTASAYVRAASDARHLGDLVEAAAERGLLGALAEAAVEAGRLRELVEVASEAGRLDDLRKLLSCR